jgi:sugar/nucleoside kinase (ribokinase family)
MTNQKEMTNQKDQPEVIVAGHICLDMLPTFDPEHKTTFADMFVPGKLNHVGESVFSSGGTVSNTGLALRQLGFRTGLMAKIGDDLFGRGLLGILDEFKSGLQLIIDPESSTSYSYVIAPPGVDRIFLHHPGANDTFCSSDLDYDSIAGARIFHFGYPPLMRRMYEQEGSDLAAILSQVKARGVTTSLDMAYPDPDSPAGKANWLKIMENALPYVDIFMPSLEELIYMLDRDEFNRICELGKNTGKDFIELFDMRALPELADRIIGMGCAVVVIKHGYKGLYMKTAGTRRLADCGRSSPFGDAGWAGQSIFAPSFLVSKIASTTGAGDASIAGVLAGILSAQPAHTSLQLGCAAAAQKIQVRKSFGGIEPLPELLIRLKDWPHEQVRDIPGEWRMDPIKRIWQVGS